MATMNLRSNKVAHALGLICVLFLLLKGAAGHEFVVGYQKSWSVPGDPNFNPYNQWAENNRFQIGDSLVFNYQSGQDSVLYVKSEDYASCHTDSPYAKFSDGHTVFKLKQSGSHFFISGNKDNCLKNEKLVVIVLADRSNHNSTSKQTSTPPSPPPSPESSSPPSPAPAGTVETIPTPAPVSEPPPPNAAASILVNFAATAGTFTASVLVLSL